MKICFCSMIFLDQVEAIEKSKIPIQLQNHKFITSIVEGLEANTNESIKLFNTTAIASYPKYKQVFWKRKLWSHDGKSEDIEIGKINIPIFKYITEYVGLKKELKNWIKRNNGEEIFILSYGRRLSHVWAINSLKKIYGNKICSCMIFADLSGALACGTTGLTAPRKYSIKEKLYAQLIEKQVEWAARFDCFVLLTKQMAQVLPIHDKQYLVIEGVHTENEHICKTGNNFGENKIVMYAGALEEQYGIKNLIDAVREIDSGYVLWIIGGGNLENEIKQIAGTDSRIKFWGKLPLDEVLKMEKKATLLVNPRQNKGEYTKYSFPSKLIEYLASGVPVIAYKLDGVPEEYDQYLNYVVGNGVEELKKSILKIGNLPKTERDEMGKQGREFIIENKNAVIQSKKIIDMFERIKGK